MGLGPPDEFRLEFKKRLKNRMEASKIDVRELAQKLGVTRSSVDQWIDFTRSTLPAIDRLPALAEVLNTTTDYLLTGDKARETDPRQMMAFYAEQAERLKQEVRAEIEAELQSLLGDNYNEAAVDVLMNKMATELLKELSEMEDDVALAQQFLELFRRMSRDARDRLRSLFTNESKVKALLEMLK